MITQTTINNIAQLEAMITIATGMIIGIIMERMKNAI